ncbi:MAG: MFS transporter [Candidatus Competibacterales bacterium]
MALVVGKGRGHGSPGPEPLQGPGPGEKKGNHLPSNALWAPLYTAVLAFMSLYAPQPVLPLLADTLAVSPEEVALLITVSLLPLGLAPVAYGYWLETVPARPLLVGATGALALTQLPFLWSDSFGLLLAARTLQGLLLPAIFTGLMAHLTATAPAGEVRRVLGYYIAATITGGFGGRLLTALMAEYASWRYAFALLALGLAAAALALLASRAQRAPSFARVRLATAWHLWRRPPLWRGYVIIFLAFGCFASLFNVLPFHLLTLDPTLGAAQLGWAYSGYLIGIVIAVNTATLSRWVGGSVAALQLGLWIFIGATLSFAIPALAWQFVAVWLFCAGMFTIHSTLSGYLNQLVSDYRGVVNGLYVACYYTGGTLGSFIPYYAYRQGGLTVYVAVLATLLLLALVLTQSLARWDRQHSPRDSVADP